MSALPPARATRLRIALALVLLEHKPKTTSLSALQDPQAQLRLAAPSPSPIAQTATRPSQTASTTPTTAVDGSPAELLRAIATAIDEHDDASGEQLEHDVGELARSWALLEQVAFAAGQLPEVEDEPVPGRAAEDEEAGMRTRGRARKASDRATRSDVERELFVAVQRLLVRTLNTPAADEPAATLAFAAPLLVHLSASFPRRAVALLAPPILVATHTLLSDLLAALTDPHLANAESARTRLARLSPALSLAHLALPAAPTLSPLSSSSPSLVPLTHAIDALVRLVAGTGVDAQLAAVRLLGEEGPSVESAVLGLLERAWAVRDAVCEAVEDGEAG
ncbi:hypothetical protein JCM8208_004448 [Rhodotorula glutinis]